MSLQQAHDLYLALLNLGLHDDLEPFLREALELVVGATRARQGYLELTDDDGGETPRWWIAHGFDGEAIGDVRRNISRGVIAAAIATGQTIVTPSAVLDPRFADRESVQKGRIEAVVCAPIGIDPPRGVLYLQGWTAPDVFSSADRELAETFCRHLAPLIDRLVTRRRRNETADATRPMRAVLHLAGIVGRSEALAAALKRIALVAPLDVTVLLTGESGTGKTQLARVIHDNGPRARQPFVELNCGTLPETLVESELFGAMPGAHSTAVRRVDGKVAAASGGTLFLDEVGELTPATQVKLLQFLQSKQYYPLGATKPEQADVRLIAATNTDLERAVAEKRFREDLFYRLHVLPIRVPSLAERKEDIAELAAFFCAAECERHGWPRLALSPAAVRAAEAAVWNGNVRQLAHAIEVAAILANGEGVQHIEPRHLFPDEKRPPEAEPGALSFQEHTRRFQQSLLEETLAACEWNVSEAARRLDLTRTHVYNLIRGFGITRAIPGG
jgi:Nif-specific regulatory protein